MVYMYIMECIYMYNSAFSPASMRHVGLIIMPLVLFILSFHALYNYALMWKKLQSTSFDVVTGSTQNYTL